MEFMYGDTVEVTKNITMDGRLIHSETRVEIVNYIGESQLSFESGSYAKIEDCKIIGRELPVERWINFKMDGTLNCDGRFVPYRG